MPIRNAMNTYSIQRNQPVYDSCFANNKTARTDVANTSGSTGDRVSFSEAGKALAEQARGKETAGAATSDTQYPLQAYSLPSWFEPYIPEANRMPTEIDSDFFEYVEKLRTSGVSSEQLQLKTKQYLDNSPSHQAELQKSAFREQYSKELAEYGKALTGYFRQSLEEAGIESTGEYYEQVVLNAETSESVHQIMDNHLRNDPRVMELMTILGTRL